MKISEKPLEFLVGIITGDTRLSNYRSGPQLVNFFNAHGESDLYGQGFPSRQIYVREKLTQLNGQDSLKEIIENALDFGVDEESRAENAAYQFNRELARDGYKLAKDHHGGFMHGDEYIPGPMFFRVEPLGKPLPKPHEYLVVHASSNEHVSKARASIGGRDYDGAISICYTIIEEFLKISLRDLGAELNENEGDIKKLFAIYARRRKMAVDQKTPDALKPLLGGLMNMVSGFYEVANKSSDRHSAKYKPSRRHAQLVVSLTFAFCEFLIESQNSEKR